MIENLRFPDGQPDTYAMNIRFKELLDSGNTEEAAKVSNEIKFIELTQSNIRLASQVKSLEMEHTILSQRILALTNQVEDYNQTISALRSQIGEMTANLHFNKGV